MTDDFELALQYTLSDRKYNLDDLEDTDYLDGYHGVIIEIYPDKTDISLLTIRNEFFYSKPISTKYIKTVYDVYVGSNGAIKIVDENGEKILR